MLSKYGASRSVLALSLGLACSVSAGAAHAANPISGMIDLDQRRATLDKTDNGVPGGMFCVPTATMNALYFLDEHGFDGLVQGSTFTPYEDQATYNVYLMGFYMGTDGQDGTTGGGFHDGLMDYLDDYAQDFMFVYEYAWDDDDTINASLLKSWLNFQGMVLLNWGAFEKADPSDSEYDRIGGHETILVGFKSDGKGGYTLTHSDPASDETPDDYYHQSMPFASGNVPVKPVYANYDGTYAKLLHSMNSGSNKAVDAITVIRPVFILHNYTNALNQVGTSSPKNEQLGGQVEISYPVTLGKGVTDMALHPLSPTGVYLQNGSTGVFQMALDTGEVTQLATLRSPRRLAYGGSTRTLFALDGSDIVGLDGLGREISRTTSRTTLDALAFDPMLNRMVAVSRSSNLIQYYDMNLRYLGSNTLPPIDGSGRLVVSIDSRSGKMYFHTDGSTIVTTAGLDTTGNFTSGRVVLQGANRPGGLFVDDHGVIFTSEGGVIHEYALTGEASRRSQVVGVSAGNIFVMPRQFSNFAQKFPRSMNSSVDEWNAEMP